jgi:small GTP-binding protein
MSCKKQDKFLHLSRILAIRIKFFYPNKKIDIINSSTIRYLTINPIQSLIQPMLHNHLVKLLLIGDAHVGKSSIVSQYVDDEFDDSISQTVGIGFKTKSIDISGTTVKFQIWDTAGQEKYKAITSAYYHGARAIIFVCSAMDKKSFYNLTQWFNDANRYNQQPDLIRIIACNKMDECAGNSTVIQLVERFGKTHNMMVFKTSAKCGTGITEMFEEVARRYVAMHADSPRHIAVKPKPLDLNVGTPNECCFS